MLLALSFAVLVVTQAPPAPTPIEQVVPPPPPPKATVIVLDDRVVKDQAPGAFLQRTEAELAKRRDVKVVKMSEGRKKLDAKSNKALGSCADDAGCLATATRDMGGDIVVTVRLTRREGAYFLALTRISALRPQLTDDAATLAGTDADALAYVAEGVGELFPDEESP